MKIECHADSQARYVADVSHPTLGSIYSTDPFLSPDSAVEAAQTWIHWFNDVPLGTVESIYYILAVPETWPGPPPNAHAYSGLHVKIGVAKDVRKRLMNLQTGTSAQLIIHALEPGSFDVEKARHRQFESDRRQGEWFACSPELTRHIMTTWSRHRVLPPEHQRDVLMLHERIDILKRVRNVLGGAPDMINPSLKESWYGSVFVDLVYANRRVK